MVGDVFTESDLFNITKGPNDITGVTTVNSLSTFAIKKFANVITDNSFIKFDVYTQDYLNLTLSILANDKTYSYALQLTGGEVWQNVNIDFCEFKDENGFTINDYSGITLLTFKSIGKYTLNNVIVL